jgi:hypothetical protein
MLAVRSTGIHDPVLKSFLRLVRQRVCNLKRNEVPLISKGQGTHL